MTMPMLLIAMCCFICLSRSWAQSGGGRKPTNVLLILADDLGYGDTSVFPFVGNGIKTPNLEAMAARGMVMTNFHTPATVCTPTRASILTGMYPWRVGIKAVYEYGKKGNSNRDDWLPQVPNVAMAFKDANYSVTHSGKWHLGGMRNDDLDMVSLSLTLRDMSFVYTVGVLFQAEWCIRQLWRSSIIVHDSTITLTHKHNTDIYPLLTASTARESRKSRERSE